MIKPVGHAGESAVHEVGKAGPTIEKVGKTTLHVAEVAAPYVALAAIAMANLDQQQELQNLGLSGLMILTSAN